jgi:CRP-like cAMP-binding protein
MASTINNAADDGLDRPRTTMPRNALLAALPAAAFARLEPYFEYQTIKRGVVLHRPGDTIHDLYFPLTCLISITVTMRDGRTAETGVVGSREVVGINAFMGGRETTQTEYVVQIAGDTIKMPTEPLRELFDHDIAVRSVMLKYTQAMLAQVTQNAACNGLHNLEQRFARWLLESRDRIGSDELQLTQEFISEMLGVRRAGVNEVSSRFEERGAVRKSHGRLQITDAGQLEAASCECYRVLAEEYDRLLGLG